ncbi:DUF305 domain-containing protein [Streptomyces europaeiscabiei]|uniref:DUF305 domain-containing protein n=1 Tax=Streptomyces europaeiscabiei TaxID=146819 RepID=UPI0029A532AF|nr:DUF305 domain-containing protein [Streptomyces europaeiscabiei]MDX3693751.1 DUF305 domain-containing protein [Streptomyces europaeiscabiei]
MTAHRKLIRRSALTATAAAAALVLAACGGGGHDMRSMDSDSSPSASAAAKAGAPNDADVDFATEMIQHHRQAIEMADVAADRASSQEVKDLATKIKGAQDPEIETMSGWLTSWGEKVPEGMSGMEGHDMSSDMPGMMSSEDMNKLEKASGAEFDEMFLEMMVEHHEGAIEMAKTEKADGKYGAATKLADDVITAQTAEIEQMNEMLGKS